MGNPGDVLIDTIKALRAPYRNGAVWVMNSNTWAEIQKWKDADGRSLVAYDLTTGAPAMLLGYPVRVSESMPDIAANAFPVAFGDWSRAYLIVRYHQMSFIRDDITSKGHTFMYFAQRYGGRILNDQAVKVIKCATS